MAVGEECSPTPHAQVSRSGVPYDVIIVDEAQVGDLAVAVA